MSSNIKNKYPPNYAVIKDTLNPPDSSLYAYDNVIYNPSGRTVYEDEKIHEEVHFAQQAQYTTIDIWWTKYLMDKDFRLEQEVEAYNKQYLFLKNVIRNKELKIALQEMAHALSHDYGLGITYSQAETMIRKYNVV